MVKTQLMAFFCCFVVRPKHTRKPLSSVCTANTHHALLAFLLFSVTLECFGDQYPLLGTVNFPPFVNASDGWRLTMCFVFASVSPLVRPSILLLGKINVQYHMWIVKVAHPVLGFMCIPPLVAQHICLLKYLMGSKG